MKHKFFVYLIFIFTCLSWGCFFRSEAEVTEETDKFISQSEALQTLEKMCTSLPFFSTVRPGEKSIGKQGNIIFYKYRLKQDFNDLKAAYKNTFLNDGWTLTEERRLVAEEYFTFEKDKMRINISNSLFDNEEYVLSCQDKSIK